MSYDCVFVEQLKNFAQPGDLFMGISGSGNSPNVLRAMEYANSGRLPAPSRLTGRDGGKLGTAGAAQHPGAGAAHGPHRRCPHDRVPHDRLLLHGHRALARNARLSPAQQQFGLLTGPEFYG